MSVNRIWKGGLWRKGLQWATGAFGLLPIGLAIFSLPVFAQIVPDNTLGGESSQVTPNVNIRGLPAERIDGGAVRGSALFHSFSEFNVNNGQRVYFSNPAGIADIFSRVTGSNVSNILGTLGVDGGANLFVLNPNGILFGPNAQLDIQGSFLATTGSSFKFSDGSEFSATQPQAAPLLSINVTPGVQWGTQPLGKINNAGNLQVGSGQTLALHGSDVTSTGSLSAPGGTVMMLGDRIGLLDHARINVSSATGGGTVLIGGGLQGKGAVPNATRTFVDAGVQIEADALTTGDGGNVIVWADEVTGFYGNISARGGTEAGNGGFVEVSGKQNLIFRGAVNTSASQGNSGTLLLDPENITIVNGNGAADDNQLNDSQILQGDGGASSFTISENTLKNLSGDTNVILQATNDITVEDLTDNSLVFQVGSGSITFTADADGNGVGSFLMQDVKDTLYTNGRNIEISGASLTLGNIDTSFISSIGSTEPKQVVVDISEGGLIADATFDFDTFTTIPGKTEFYFNVSEGGSISDLDLVFSAEHSWDSDLAVSLKSPGGTSLNLFSGVGGYGKNFQDTLLDDEAQTNINQGTAPFKGSFRPDGNLAIFDGQNPNGKWTLTVTDNASGDSGRLLKAGDSAFGETAQGTQLVFQLVTTQPVSSPGNSGSIKLNATNGNISAVKLNTANSFGAGGAINLNATGDIAIANNTTTGGLTTDGLFSRSSSGNGGSIALTAGGSINLTNTYINSTSGFLAIDGKAGDIKIEAGSTNPSQPAIQLVDTTIDAAAFGSKGQTGRVTLNASNRGDMTLQGKNYQPRIYTDTFGGQQTSGMTIFGGNIVINNYELSAPVNNGSTADGGNIFINGNSVTVLNGSRLTTSTSAQGKSGNITIQTTSGNITLANGSIETKVESGATGNGGDIRLDSKGGAISLTNDSSLNASTYGTTNGGRISINSGSGAIALSNQAKITTNAAGNGGNAGEISVNGSSLSITGDSQISAAVEQEKQGNAGNINITVQGATNLSGKESRIMTALFTEAKGRGGTVTLKTGSLTVDNQAAITASTRGKGDGGNITIEAQDGVSLERGGRISSPVRAGAVGNAGIINLTSGSLSLSDGGKIETLVEPAKTDDYTQKNLPPGQGNAGTVNLTVRGATNLSGAATTIVNSIGQGVVGNGDTITINTGTLTLTGGASIDSSMAGTGNGGDINITAPNSVTLSAGGQISAETSGSRQAGSVKITTPTLNVNGGAKVSTTTTSTVNTGTGGDITVSANTLNLSGAKSGLFAETEGAADAGNLELNPYSGGNDLQVNFAQGSQISASTSGSGTGGNIRVSAPNSSVTLRGDRSDKGGLSASASGQGNGGSIDINARSLDMGGATIRSEATNSNAGDIKLTLDDRLLLTHGSLISTTANTGNGGNITIKAPSAFVIAVPSENSDIIANAFSGNGGQINISAYRVFGLKPQSRQSFDTLRQNRTSDISASSQSGIQGNINIQSLSVDPSQGLTALPVDIVDPSRQIVNRCGADNAKSTNAQGEFVVTGRGGLPPSPDDMQTSGAIPPSWVTRDGGNISRSAAPVEPPATPSSPPLVEAQGMFINAKGEVVLTAQTSTTTPHQPGIAEPLCLPATNGNE